MGPGWTLLRRGAAEVKLATSLWATALAVCALLGAAASASAAPFPLPRSTNNLQPPAVAVDSSGNAYVAWWDKATSTSSFDVFTICTIPAGATACSHQVQRNGPAGMTYAPDVQLFIDTAGHPQLIISDRNGATGAVLQFQSTDGGASWPFVTVIGDLPLSSAALDPALDSGFVFGAAHSGSGYNVAATSAGLGGGSADVTLVPAGSDSPTQTASAVSDTATGIALAHVWDSGIGATMTHGTGYAVYTGPSLKGQSASSVRSRTGLASNWTVRTLGDDGNELSLAGGPSGIFLTEHLIPGGLVIRSLTGSSFGAAATADCGDTARYGAGLQDENLFADPSSGALHLLYVEGDGSGNNDIRYTELHGGTQSPPVTLASNAGLTIYPRVASGGSSHPGLAVWETAAGSGSYNVNAQWLPSVSLTGCPPSTTGGGGGAGSTAPKPATATATLGGSGGEQLTLNAPTGGSCNSAKGSLAVSLTARSLAKGKKGNGLKFAQASFFVDRGVAHKHRVRIRGRRRRFRTVITYKANGVARRLPAHPRFSLAHLKPGMHTLTVKVSFRHTVRRHGRKITLTITKTLKLRFKIC